MADGLPSFSFDVARAAFSSCGFDGSDSFNGVGALLLLLLLLLLLMVVLLDTDGVAVVVCGELFTLCKVFVFMMAPLANRLNPLMMNISSFV